MTLDSGLKEIVSMHNIINMNNAKTRNEARILMENDLKDLENSYRTKYKNLSPYQEQRLRDCLNIIRKSASSQISAMIF